MTTGQLPTEDTTTVTLTIKGPFIERSTWDTVRSAFCEHWPIDGIESTSVRIARSDGEHAMAEAILKKIETNYRIHRNKMAAFYGMIDELEDRDLPPPNKAELVVDHRNNNSCKLILHHRKERSVLQVPQPITLERLLNPRHRCVRPLSESI